MAKRAISSVQSRRSNHRWSNYCVRREKKGAGRMGSDGTGLAEAAGLVSRSDRAVDDFVGFEPAGDLPMPWEHPRHPSWDKPWTLAERYLVGPSEGCLGTRADGSLGTLQASPSGDSELSPTPFGLLLHPEGSLRVESFPSASSCSPSRLPSACLLAPAPWINREAGSGGLLGRTEGVSGVLPTRGRQRVRS